MVCAETNAVECCRCGGWNSTLKSAILLQVYVSDPRGLVYTPVHTYKVENAL